jgi:hypothetical protein
MTTLSGYYQLPEDAKRVGLTQVEADLLDFTDGQLLYASGTDEPVTAPVDEVVLSSGTAYPVVFASDTQVLTVDQGESNQSEVSETILGIPKEERQLGLFSVVNSYGADPQNWRTNTGGASSYTYSQDPTSYTFDGDYGYYQREVKSESALQAYCFPKPESFEFPFDDGTGRFPGGYTDGVMTQYWETKRSFRYQPGRITGVTMGVRMSTNSQHTGEVITWGVRNGVGDGYYFELDRGTDLYVVRQSPDLGTLKIPRDSWNGDPITIGPDSATNWTLDLRKVTMFAVQFGWYGAIGAEFLAYVPIGLRDARWVRLHSITASNEYEYPSLRSPFMKVFCQARTTAGTTQPAFINLYGSSVYIDGGDDGTLSTGSASLDEPKLIDSTDRSILGLQLKPTVNGVRNQQNLYPINLGLRSDVDAKVTMAFKSLPNDINYTPGYGTILSRGTSASIPVTRLDDVTLSGNFPDISAELSGTLNYLDGRRVKVEGAGIFRTHVTAYDPTFSQITVDRELPGSVTSVRLSRFDAWALSSGVISSGVDSGSLFYNTNGGYWRLGLLPNASGVDYDQYNDEVCWFASKYPGLNFNPLGSVTGEDVFPSEPYIRQSFVVATGSSTSTISAGGQSITVSGVDPYPIKVVAELQDSASVQDILFTTTAESNITIPGSGSVTTFPLWTVSGVTQSDALAGGDTYRASKFEDAQNKLNPAAVVDKQGYRVLQSPNRVATYYVQSGEAVQYDLSPIFGPDRMFIGGVPGTIENTGALFVTASARNGSGYISASLDWEEQQ